MDRVSLVLGRYDDAIRMLQLSAEANPNDSLAYTVLAAAYALWAEPRTPKRRWQNASDCSPI